VAVQRLNLAVPRGECFGLLGENGAGKTTTISIVTGFITPTLGTATVVGHDIRSAISQVGGFFVCVLRDIGSSQHRNLPTILCAVGGIDGGRAPAILCEIEGSEEE